MPSHWTAAGFCDGGLVSNLPAWAFAAESWLDPETWTITVEIEGDSEALAGGRKRPPWGTLLKRMLMTAVFGSHDLNLRGLERHVAIRIKPGQVSTLDFDIKPAPAMQLVNDARERALIDLKVLAINLPELLERACEELREAIEDLLDSLQLLAPGAPGRSTRVRIFEQEPRDGRILRVIAADAQCPAALRSWRLIDPSRGPPLGITIACDDSDCWMLDGDLRKLPVRLSVGRLELSAADWFARWTLLVPVPVPPPPSSALDRRPLNRQLLLVIEGGEGASELASLDRKELVAGIARSCRQRAGSLPLEAQNLYAASDADQQAGAVAPRSR